MKSLDTVRPEIPLQVITPADVRASIGRAKRSLEKAADEIVWQIEMEAWRTLGYSSWTAMREAEYGGAAFMVPRKDRPELVSRLRANGLTQQSIADTIGASEDTVRRDLNTANAGFTTTVINARGQQRPATYHRPNTNEDEVIDAEIIEDDITEFCSRCGATQDGCTCAAKQTGPAPAEPTNNTITCPTCHGTGKVTQ